MKNSVNTKNTHRKEPLRAVCYLRVARARDADPTAVEAQRRACESKAQELGATVADEYVDVGSGNTIGSRPALRTMLARLESDQHIHYMITYDHARLARNIDVYRKIVRALETAGVELVIVKEPGPHYRKFMQTLTAAMADLAARQGHYARRVKKVRP